MSEQNVSVSRLPAAEPSSSDIQRLRPELLTAYKLMLQYQFIGAVGLMAIFAAALLASYTSTHDPPLLVLVMLAGVLGAYFSALTRLYDVDQLTVALVTPTISQLGGRYLVMYSLMPPIIGAIAAVVLYVIFVGGLLGGGGIFPSMGCSEGAKCNSLVNVLRYFGPKDAVDYGKVLVWAFVAGFSERLVPDTLQSLVAKLQHNSGS
jgi:hypothetical protein